MGEYAAHAPLPSLSYRPGLSGRTDLIVSAAEPLFVFVPPLRFLRNYPTQRAPRFFHSRGRYNRRSRYGFQLSELESGSDARDSVFRRLFSDPLSSCGAPAPGARS